MKKLLTSFFGLGYLPFAPGTWGSLPPVILYILLAYLHSGGIIPGLTIPGWTIPGVMGLMLVCGAWVCTQFGPSAIGQTGLKKADFIVADEVAGAALTLLLMTILAPAAGIWVTAAVGLMLFRLFDILKPWPCRRLEQLPGGWGILAGDLAAGLWAAGVWGLGRHLNGAVTAFVALFSKEGTMSAGFSFFLGTVQGLTEFLPVSSSGHLVFFESFSEKINTESPEMLLFDLCLHVGTVFSILVVFRARIVRYFRQLGRSFLNGRPLRQRFEKNAAFRFTVLAIAATFTTGAFYAIFKDPLESARSLLVVALMWLVTAGLLLAADYRRGKKGLRDFGFQMAIVIGLFQGLAILPGISRSGATICAAILLGLKVRWAIEFSFLISIPAILGGTAIHVLKNYSALAAGDVALPHLLLGAGSAFIVGIVALKILIVVSKRRELKYFAAYCALMALITLISFL